MELSPCVCLNLGEETGKASKDRQGCSSRWVGPQERETLQPGQVTGKRARVSSPGEERSKHENTKSHQRVAFKHFKWMNHVVHELQLNETMYDFYKKY